MVQIQQPQVEQKKKSNLLGNVLQVGGAVAGGIFGGPAGAMAGAQAGGMIGGILEKPQAQVTQPQGLGGGPMERRAGVQDGDAYNQLKAGLMASTNLPPDMRAQHAPQIAQAIQKMAVG